MPRDFFPRAEFQVLTWSRNFVDRIESNWAAYGLTEAQVIEYRALHDAFAEAFGKANSPKERTPSGIVTKDAARLALERRARKLAAIIRSMPFVTDPERLSLGLSARPPKRRRRIPPPTHPPTIRVTDVKGSLVSITLRDSREPTRRARPRDVTGAVLLWYVGETPPRDLEGWSFGWHTGGMRVKVRFEQSLSPGTRVWITACWANRRGEGGPFSTPVSAHLGWGHMQFGSGRNAA